MAGVTDLQFADMKARLENLEIRSRSGSPVAPGTKYPSTCSTVLVSGGSRCLVNYHYPMSFSDTLKVAEEAGFKSKIALSGPGDWGVTQPDTFLAEDQKHQPLATESEGKVPPKKVDLPPFQPDWRFWTGVTLSGLGLFFYRNR